MNLCNVSFGRIIAVSGKPQKMKNVDSKLRGQSGVMSRDMTYYYRNALMEGQMAQDVKDGNVIKIYITGKERQEMIENNPKWKDDNYVLSCIHSYYNADTLSISKIVDCVLKSRTK